MPPDGWDEWSKHVLSELKRLSLCYEGLRGVSEDIRIEIAKLKIKSGVWGLLGGLVPVTVLIVLYLIKNGR